MRDMILLLGTVVMFVYGYYLMKKLDCFLDAAFPPDEKKEDAPSEQL